jgi:hypothetical protein
MNSQPFEKNEIKSNSGRRQAGCCIHIATLIYYLSYAKHRPSKLILPAEHLNTVFIDMSINQAPNKPIRVRHKRYVKEESSDNSNSDSDDEIVIDELNENELDEENSKQTDSSEINIESEEMNLDVFNEHIPSWGAHIKYRNQNVDVTNACTIDYFLFAFWVLNYEKPKLIDTIADKKLKDNIKKIVQNIEKLEWDDAKQHWLVSVMKYNENPVSNTISLWGSLHDRFVHFFITEQTHNLKQFCRKNCILNNQLVSEGREILMFEKSKNDVKLHAFPYKNCKECRKKALWEFEFIKDPRILFIEPANRSTFDKIPKVLQLGNKKFRLLMCHLHMPSHFVGIFIVNNKTYLVDDLTRKSIFLPPFTTLDTRTRNELNKYFFTNTAMSMYYCD